MNQKPSILNPSELARRIEIVRKRLLSQDFETYNHTKDSYPIKNLTASTPSKTTTLVVTLSNAVYKYHANSQGKINHTFETTFKSDTQWKLEWGFWVLLIFFVFLCSVIMIYCILRKLEDTMCYEDDWMDENLDLETDLNYFSQSKTALNALYVGSTSNLKESSEKDASAKCIRYGVTDEPMAKLKTNLSPNSSKMGTINISKTSGVKLKNQTAV